MVRRPKQCTDGRVDRTLYTDRPGEMDGPDGVDTGQCTDGPGGLDIVLNTDGPGGPDSG